MCKNQEYKKDNKCTKCDDYKTPKEDLSGCKDPVCDKRSIVLPTGVCELCKAFTRPNDDKKICIKDDCSKEPNQKLLLEGGCEKCKDDEKVSSDLFFCVKKEPKADDKKTDKYKEEDGKCTKKGGADLTDTKDEEEGLTLDKCKEKCGDDCTAISFKEEAGADKSKCKIVKDAGELQGTAAAGEKCHIKEKAADKYTKTTGTCKVDGAAADEVVKYDAAAGKAVEDCEKACDDLTDC